MPYSLQAGDELNKKSNRYYRHAKNPPVQEIPRPVWGFRNIDLQMLPYTYVSLGYILVDWNKIKDILVFSTD